MCKLLPRCAPPVPLLYHQVPYDLCLSPKPEGTSARLCLSTSKVLPLGGSYLLCNFPVYLFHHSASIALWYGPSVISEIISIITIIYTIKRNKFLIENNWASISHIVIHGDLVLSLPRSHPNLSHCVLQKLGYLTCSKPYFLQKLFPTQALWSP